MFSRAFHVGWFAASRWGLKPVGRVAPGSNPWSDPAHAPRTSRSPWGKTGESIARATPLLVQYDNLVISTHPEVEERVSTVRPISPQRFAARFRILDPQLCSRFHRARHWLRASIR